MVSETVAEPPGGGWRIELFGALRAVSGERVITRFRTQKTALLLAYLAYHRQGVHARSVLIDLLWPEGDPEVSRHNLSVALSSLREQLSLPSAPDTSVIVSDRFSLRLNPERVTTDVGEFDAALRSAAEAGNAIDQRRRLARAVELYRGPLLPGYYEEWILTEQQRLNEAFFQAVRQLIAHLEGAGERDAALQTARRAAAVDPLREEAHQEIIRLLVAAGQPNAALRQYRELERLLQRELETTPSESTRALLAARAPSVIEAGSFGSMVVGSQEPRAASQEPRAQRVPSLEPVGGAVPLGSPFYVVRSTDPLFAAAIARQDSIVLVKGPRQVGKTSLLVRGLDHARRAGAAVVLTDFEALNAVHLESANALLLALAESLADRLALDASPGDDWDVQRGANPNFWRFMQRQVLARIASPLVWGLDEVDRLFHYDFGTEIFALFRSWHNERALDPSGPWSRLTMAMAYATEAHFFITDLNRSPFNVGTRLSLDDFTVDQVADLNGRCRSPLKEMPEVARFYFLVGGHPYLVRRGLYEMATRDIDIAGLESRADAEGGIYGDHLQRLITLLHRAPALTDAVRELLAGRHCPDASAFYRLRSAGLLTGATEEEATFRCRLYERFLRRRLG